MSKITQSKSYKVLMDGLWNDHPLCGMILGICSSLAITNKVENAIVMGLGVTFCLVCASIIISAMRNFIPVHMRIIVYMIVIASFVIIVDRFVKAFYPDISEAIGPYIGLIITNCILMGRAEAFAIKNNVFYSILDAIGYGLGFSYTLIIFAVIRESLGFGSILGMQVMPHNWTNWVVMVMAPGAFFVFSIYIWIYKTLRANK